MLNCLILYFKQDLLRYIPQNLKTLLIIVSKCIEKPNVLRKVRSIKENIHKPVRDITLY